MKFYCQNMHQSGDTTGVAMALVLGTDKNICFLMNQDELTGGCSFVQFYHDLGVERDRICVVVADTDTEKRGDTGPLTPKQQQSFDKKLQTLEDALNEPLEDDDDGRYRKMREERYRKEKFKLIKEEMGARIGAVALNQVNLAGKLYAKELFSKHRASYATKALTWATHVQQQPSIERPYAWLVHYAEMLLVWDPTVWVQSSIIAQFIRMFGISPLKITENARSGNQIYQDIVNLGLRTKKKPELKEFYKLVFMMAQPSSPKAQFQHPALHQYLEVGQTTRDMKSYLEEHKLAATVKALHKPFTQRPVGAVTSFTNSFVDRVLSQIKGLYSKWSKIPMFVLIWVRGLSGTELKSFQSSNIRPGDISDSKLEEINAFKRNPHHVMTAQLYGTIVRLLRQLSKQGSRHFVPIPIGDEIHFDQYDPKTEKLVKESPDNLVKFFTRLQAFKGSRYAQMCLIYELFKCEKIGLIQIGIRSGAMEQGMYLGAPTIYIEEEFAESGARMSRLTRWGSVASDLDSLFLEALELAAQSEKPAELRRQLGALRESLQFIGYRSSIVDQLNLKGNYGPAQQKVKEILNKWKTLPSKKSSFAEQKQYPFFYRLVTKNLVGLNQARTRVGYESFMQALSTNEPVEARLLKGSLRESELNLLESFIKEISWEFEAYREAIIPALKDKQKPAF